MSKNKSVLIPPPEQMMNTIIKALFNSFEIAAKNQNVILMIKLSPELQTWLKMVMEQDGSSQSQSIDKVKEEWINKLKNS